MDTWYKEKAKKTYEELTGKLYPLAKKYEIEKPCIDMRVMKARWGSALVDSNTILLNTELIKAP
ncbi:YgjP-like metallopeptidase domain-containing protein [Lysinibacillus sp. NPDC093688]|uniref:YgjP-like metallopeptidase domain-containing protein n=1 Tax=Lysinibacillus sp. NPDC093688 TaxID=3390577 RepID=UPI003D00D839